MNGTSRSYATLRIGKLTELVRYPVKSFGGERLNRVRLERYGLYGDRARALVDPTKTDFARYVTARQYPQLLSYTAQLHDVRDSAAAFSEVAIEAPNGEWHGWDERLQRELSSFIKRPLTLDTCSPSPGGNDNLHVDEGSVLIVTDASLRELERCWGKPADRRRFRPNLVLALDDSEPFAETAWIGRRLRIGDTELRIDALCQRCRMIGFDPDTLERDDTLLAWLHRHREDCFGVYASVSQTGILEEGAEVRLVQEA